MMVAKTSLGHRHRNPRVLAIGAHGDDIEGGAGGTVINLASAGASLALCVLTDGSRGGDPVIRQRVAQSAAEALGAELILGGLPDARIRLGGAIAVIKKAVLDFEPDWVLAHHASDSHQDHRIAARATLSVTRSVPNVAFYEGPTSIGFVPTSLVDITPVIDRKLDLIRSHRSQLARTRITSWAFRTALYRGISLRRGISFAEGFRPYRMLLPLGGSSLPDDGGTSRLRPSRNGSAWIHQFRHVITDLDQDHEMAKVMAPAELHTGELGPG
jgi:LmbE family N-acetylglucosaminyl deacetylase